MEEIIKKLEEIIHNVMPQVKTEGVTKGTLLQQDLGINSLSMLLLALSIEKEFNIRFDAVSDFKTVGDVAEYINNKITIQ